MTCLGRKLFGTKQGYIGVGDITLQEGDLICVLFGGKVPFIPRRKEDRGYRFVGSVILRGL
jgi:hypothetical protein